MTPKGLELHVRRAIATDPVAERLDSLLRGNGKPALPAGLGGPLLELLRSPELKQVESLPSYRDAVTFGNALDLPDPLRGGRLPDTARAAFFHLSELADSLPRDCCAARPAAAPAVSSVERYETLDCCAAPTGEPLGSAAPGTFVRLVGSGLSVSAEEAIVRFDGARASVVKCSETSMVVMVPPVGLRPGTFQEEEQARSSRSRQRRRPQHLATGECTITVETTGGSTSIGFAIDPLPEADPATIGEAMAATRRVLGKLSERVAVGRPGLEKMLESEPSAAAAALLNDLPDVSAELARQLEAVPAVLPLLSGHRATGEKLIAGIIASARTLEYLAALEAELDDPETNLPYGSGLTDAICKIHEFVTMLVAVVVAIALVVIVVIVALILVAIFTEVGLVLVPILVSLLIPVLYWTLVVVYVAVVVEVITTILYVVAKALQYVGKALSWLFGSSG